VSTERHVWTDERIDDMVDRLDKNIDLLRNDMRAGFASVDARFAATDERMREGFAAMDARFTAMDERMADGFTSLRRDMLAAVLTMTGALVATLATILATTL
jgi:hypothetical protein